MGSIPSTANPKEQNINNDPAVRDKSTEIKSNVTTDDRNAQQPSNTTADKQMNSPKSESKSETDETDALPPEVSGANESVEDVSSTDDSGGSGKPMKDSKTKIASLEAEVRQLRDEKHKLFIRLSEMGAVRLTENNPNISDLSDPNRPEKLVEQFSELYDNEWTNVFECLTQVYGLQENETIRQLLDILQKIYQICLESTRTQADDLKKAIVSYLGLSEEDKDQSAIKETEKGLQERRAKEFKRNLDLVTEVVREKLKDQLDGKNHEALDKYVQKCTNICWLMCIKDPQMHLYFGENQNDRSPGDDANNDSLHFDATKFTCFTTTGMYMEYVVWPAVYLYKNGPIVKKGVAQGSNTKLETKESTGTNKEENAKDNGDQNTIDVDQEHTKNIPDSAVSKLKNMEGDGRYPDSCTNAMAQDKVNGNTQNCNIADFNRHDLSEPNQDKVLCEENADNRTSSNSSRSEKSSDEKKKINEDGNVPGEDEYLKNKNECCDEIDTEKSMNVGSDEQRTDTNTKMSKKKRKKKKKEMKEETS